jgi:hypothetical protein
MNQLMKKIPLPGVAFFPLLFMPFYARELASFAGLNKYAINQQHNNSCISIEIDSTPVYQNDAEVLNADKSMRPCNTNDPCNCPGGFFIHIEGLPAPHGKCISCSAFKALEFPENFDLGNEPAFPISVPIYWKFDSLSCDSSRIHIISISKR